MIDFEELKNRTRASLGLYAETSAMTLESYAKENKPWTNRTTMAWKTTKGSWGWEGDTLQICISGNTPYYKYLELAMEKRFSILVPTMTEHASEILEGMRDILK